MNYIVYLSPIYHLWLPFIYYFRSVVKSPVQQQVAQWQLSQCLPQPMLLHLIATQLFQLASAMPQQQRCIEFETASEVVNILSVSYVYRDGWK